MRSVTSKENFERNDKIIFSFKESPLLEKLIIT